MSTTIHCDIGRIEQGLEKLDNNDEYDRLDVMDTYCVMRGITLDEMKERNIHHHAEQIATIKKKSSSSYKFKFHQNQMDEEQEFCFRPPGLNEIDPDYCMTPGELGEKLAEVEEELNNIFSDISWDFSKVDAASIAHGGYLTSFEFEYEFVVIR